MNDRRVHVHIRPRARWSPINARELWEFRDLLGAFAGRDVRLRYRQTALGAAWVVFQPLVGAGIFTFVFGRVAGLSSDGVPYYVYSFAGLVGWNVFASTLTKASNSLVAHQAMVSKVFFPRLLLPFSVVGSTLIELAIGVLVLGVLLLVAGIAPGLQILLAPLWLLGLLTLGTAGGLIAAAVSVRYRDVQYALPVFAQLALYATPVAYGLSSVPAGGRLWVEINPVTGFLEAFRWSLFGRSDFRAAAIAWSILATLIASVTGLFVFSSLERDFADVI